MWKTFLILAVGVGACVIYSHRDDPVFRKWLQPAAQSNPAATSPASSSTAPAAGAVIPAVTVQTVEEKRLAPPGVFYIIERIKKNTDAGIVALSPGEKVSLLGRKGTKMQVSDGAVDFEIESTQATNDLEVAELARRKDAGSREALAVWMRQQKSLKAQQDQIAMERQVADQKADDARNLELARIAAQQPKPTPTPNPLDRGGYDRVQAMPQFRYYYDSYGGRYYIDRYGRWVY